ncbi:MAG: glycosyl hydrolase [Luteolibacter sp.]
MNFNFLLFLAIALSLSSAVSYGGVSIAKVGSGTGYDATTAQAKAWRSTSVAKGSLDFSGYEYFGNAGFWTAGDGTDATSYDGSPVWVSTFVRGSVAAAISSYTSYDNPTLLVASTVADWATTGISGDTTGGGSWNTYLTFNITNEAPGTFRIGVMAGNEQTSDGRWDPTGLRLSFNGGTAVAVTGLEVTALGMVFWDVTVTGGTTGTFKIEGQGRTTGIASGSQRGGSMSAVTFDIIPPPYTATLLEWNPTSSGNGTDLFDEANWIDPVTGTTPPPGTVEPNADINRSLVIRAGTPGGNANFGADGNLKLGTGNLTVSNATLRMSESSASSINMGTGSKNLTLDNGNVFTHSVVGGNVIMDGYSDLTLYAPWPLNSGATVNLKSPNCFVYFLNKIPSDVLSSELSKIKVNGANAVNGNNVLVTQYYNGSVVRAKLPNNGIMTAFDGADLTGDSWNFSTGFKGRIGAGLIDYTASSGVYNVDGWGSDIWGTGDECRFTYRNMTGDCEIIAKVTWVQDTHTWAKGGVMMRSDLTDGSPNAFVCQNPGKQVAFQVRTAQNASTTNDVPNVGTGNVKWVRLVRSGNDFTAYYNQTSATGPWIKIGNTETINMPSTIKVGIAATSHIGLERGRTNFLDVSTVPAKTGSIGIFTDSVDIESSFWLEEKISSFLLKKGYMVTLSNQGGGQGFSKVYVASEADLKVNLPAELNDNVRFMRILPWRWVAKRGWAGGNGDHMSLIQAYWNYEWEPTGSSTNNREFVPMIKGRGQDKEERWLEVRSRADQTHFLIFNEPESENQGDLTVDEAIALWPKAQQAGLRLVSPGRTDGSKGDTWLSSFMSKAEAKGYRVDAISVHNYNKKTASSLKTWLTAEYNKYKRPIWLTEFQRDNGDNPTSAEQQAYLAEVIPMLEGLWFVERYAYFNFNTGGVTSANATLFNNGPTLNANGEIYRNVVSQPAYRNTGQPAWATASLNLTNGGVLQLSNGGQITASPSLSSSMISNVEFFVNGVSVGKDTSSPYQLAVSKLGYGMQSIYSVITTKFGETFTSPVSQIFVTEFGTLAPTAGAPEKIKWSSVPGETYHIESSVDMFTWNKVQTRVATGFVETTTAPAWGTGSKRFYRVSW